MLERPNERDLFVFVDGFDSKAEEPIYCGVQRFMG